MLSRRMRDGLWDGTWDLQAPRFSFDWHMKGLRRRPMRSWYWHRILFTLGVLCAFATCVYLEAVAWL